MERTGKTKRWITQYSVNCSAQVLWTLEECNCFPLTIFFSRWVPELLVASFLPCKIRQRPNRSHFYEKGASYCRTWRPERPFKLHSLWASIKKHNHTRVSPPSLLGRGLIGPLGLEKRGKSKIFAGKSSLLEQILVSDHGDCSSACAHIFQWPKSDTLVLA